ncbi:PE-PGRS virulence associated protein [Micavibrio aeruginosavorus]|uniref:PE-PGRS virulence associated protein n=1 Tax=Micavibrio aeruginosavorus TaxID=349221 RepID=UPI003F4AD954
MPASLAGVLACVILVGVSATPAYAACTSPAASTGSLEWFSGTSEFKYCDNTNIWISIGGAGLPWVKSGSNIYYNTGSVAIGSTNPQGLTLNVNGGLRLADSGTACNSTYEGVMRYSAAKNIEFCNGTSWKALAGPGIETCTVQEYTTPGSYSYTVLPGCEDLAIDAYGAGGGGGYASYGGGGGGSSRVQDESSTILALGGGGGGGAGDSGTQGGGGGGGYGKKIVTLSAGDNLLVVVGEGGESGCGTNGGLGGNPDGGTFGNTSNGGNATYGGGGGADSGYRGGISTYGGGGGGGDSTSNSGSTTDYGGAGGSDSQFACGTSTYGGPCGGEKSGGGGGYGIGDIVLTGLNGNSFQGGYAANSGPGQGSADGSSCARGGNGKVVIRPF